MSCLSSPPNPLRMSCATKGPSVPPYDENDKRTHQRRLGKLPPNAPRPPRHPEHVARKTVPQHLEAERRSPRQPDQAQVERRRSLEETLLGAVLGLLLRHLSAFAALCGGGGGLGDGVEGGVDKGGGGGLGEDEEVGNAERTGHGDEITESVGFPFLRREKALVAGSSGRVLPSHRAEVALERSSVALDPVLLLLSRLLPTRDRCLALWRQEKGERRRTEVAAWLRGLLSPT